MVTIGIFLLVLALFLACIGVGQFYERVNSTFNKIMVVIVLILAGTGSALLLTGTIIDTMMKG